MTEAEWLASVDPWPMVRLVRNSTSDRRGWLYVAALIAATKGNPIKSIVGDIEAFADSRLTRSQLAAAWSAATTFPVQLDDCLPWSLVMDSGATTVIGGEGFDRCKLIRCVFNPFAPMRKREKGTWRQTLIYWFKQPRLVDPQILTAPVTGLAESIYADRAFDRLPILADALEEAGCDNADILAHCRSDGPHVRGCWVVDLLTGRQ